jgi:hypothetical protein
METRLTGRRNAGFISILIISIFSSTWSYGQSNLELYGSYIHNLNKDYKNNTQGVGLRFEWGRGNESVTKYIGLAYGFPMHVTSELEARAYDNFTSPSTVNVTAKYSQPMVRLEGGGKLYLSGSGSSFEGLNSYLNGGAEVLYIQNKPTYSEYDKDNYTLGFTDESDVNPDGSEKFGLNLHITFGFGIEKTVGSGNLFLQCAISLPALHGNEPATDVQDFTPIPLNVNLGYKLPIGKTE